MAERRLWSRRLDALALLVLSLLVAAGSAYGAWNYLQFVDLYRTAAALERGETVSDGVLQRREPDVKAVVVRAICDEATIRAAVTAVLSDLGRRNPADDYDRWAQGLETAQRLVRHAVGCSPRDGNFWTRLAMVERLVAASPERLATLLSMSANLAPAGIHVLQARFVVWRSLPDWPSKSVDAILDRDLALVLGRAELYDIRLMLANAPPSLRARADRSAALLSAERRKDLLRVDVGGTAKPAPRRSSSSFDMIERPRR